jgi:hypothetical protein
MSTHFEVTGRAGTAVILKHVAKSEWVAVLTQTSGERWVSDDATHPSRAELWAEKLANHGSWVSARAHKVSPVIDRLLKRDYVRV